MIKPFIEQEEIKIDALFETQERDYPQYQCEQKNSQQKQLGVLLNEISELGLLLGSAETSFFFLSIAKKSGS